MTRKHVEFLAEANTRHFAEGRIGYETNARFQDQQRRCDTCPLLDNGKHGDILEECRVGFLRFFVAMKRDAERRMRVAGNPNAPIDGLPGK